MNVHEHQAKELLARYGIEIGRGRVAYSPEDAEKIFNELGAARCAVKAQIHAGGRGKGRIYAADNRDKLVLDGGVKLAAGAGTAKAFAAAMLGNVLVTKQTGPAGRTVKRVYVEAAADIARELYAGIVLDRVVGLPVLMVSTEGGMEIEEVAAKTPEKILKIHFCPTTGLAPFQLRKAAFFLGLTGDAFKGGCRFFAALAKAFGELDASLVEINPLVVAKDCKVSALDAKINFDDSALFRHPDLAALRDPNEEDPNETEARKFDLSYVALDGEIGCLVNGAGLAMATMDIIKLRGREPANFLDVGGSADEKKVTAAFKIILGDPKVRAILVNIFGGIMHCDVIARGVVAASKAVGVTVPLIVRLEGTNVEEGRRILAESGLEITAADSLPDAAAKAVAAAASAA